MSDDEDEDAITRYRPVGPHELALIAASGYRAFPPRLPEQPIFYPVVSQEYATQIARDWNVPFSRIYRFMPEQRTYLVPASSGPVSPESPDSSQSVPLHRRFDCPTNCRPASLN